MRWQAAVTFEFLHGPPREWRGIVEATGPQTCVSRAVATAKGVIRPRGYSSLVVVLLDRLDRGTDAEDESEDMAESEAEATAEV